MNPLKKMITLLLWLGLWLCCAHPSHAYDLLDKAVAIVEEDVILESQLRRRIAHVQFQNPALEGQISEALKQQILEQLVYEQLQLALARRAKLTISPQEIDDALASFSRHLSERGTSVQQYQQTLRIDSAQLRRQLEQDLQVQKVQQASLNQRIRITEREIDEFLNSKEGQQWLKPRYNLGHILLPLTEADDSAVAQRADTLYRQLQHPAADFKTLAASVSQGPNAAKGGSLGWRDADELPALFIQQADQLQPGQISAPFRSNAGIHLIKLYQRTGAEAVWVERAKVRHILVKSSALFTEDEAKDKIDRLHQALTRGADFAALAREQTDDLASKSEGGDLGWSTPGQFVPVFEQAMSATAVGQFSQPFRSPFGWHILLVEQRRTDNMFETVKRNRAASLLRSRRFQDELQLWLQELHASAYISLL
ncbi:MAG: peptidylprolyl isomerase [Cellvibrionaceae bacterium]|nr:peptidylprolyl isomerase [Cellvibrionaceae bacterium]